ncbi:MAG: hypothetical protein Hyperionvirus18_5 [Hyperionvirus sp.]|uniref:Uncharacterized protein n=1 Tax=Hyperionvirus sp. TaxID=2487770 RepID=A0A3G5AFH5_9VIRU|nr:MAG: hypothetical protein Hyperionvirus18_5 [Hyperionvirus sp.]
MTLVHKILRMGHNLLLHRANLSVDFQLTRTDPFSFNIIILLVNTRDFQFFCIDLNYRTLARLQWMFVELRFLLFVLPQETMWDFFLLETVGIISIYIGL